MTTALAAGLGMLIGLTVGVLLSSVLPGRHHHRNAERDRLRATALEGACATLKAENEALRRQQGDARSLDDLLRPVRDGLESLRRATDSSSRDRTQAEATLATQISSVQERYQSLETATKQLASALARGQTRGQWGEMQLEGLLAHSGLIEGTHYRRQDTRQAGDGIGRPDMVVLMPGGGEILVDAKFPFDAYWQGTTTEDAAVRDQSMRKHAADVLSRAKELSAKGYSDSHASADFVVMFLPVESLLSAALEADGLLLERTFALRVVLATPTTMLALLRTIGFGYQRQLMAENADEIKRAGAEMLSRLGVLAEHLEGMRRGLDQAVRGYKPIRRQLRYAGHAAGATDERPRRDDCALPRGAGRSRHRPARVRTRGVA